MAPDQIATRLDNKLPAVKGSYILFINLPQRQAVRVGSRGRIYFPRGVYLYVGSAMGGFKLRLSRHLQYNKKFHWHIDYLLGEARLTRIILIGTRRRIECSLARALSHQLPSIAGFGSSDCKCPSHLFMATSEKKAESGVIAALSRRCSSAPWWFVNVG